MRLLLSLLILLVPIAAWAADPPASEALLKRLMEVTQTRKMMDAMWGQMDTYMQSVMKQASSGRILTAREESVLADMRKKMVALMQEEMKWDVMESQFIEIYQKTFTEKEVRGMLEFYESPAGQAVIVKMPVVMQHSMGLMQRQMENLMPKIKKLQEETTEQLKECQKKNGC